MIIVFHVQFYNSTSTRVTDLRELSIILKICFCNLLKRQIWEDIFEERSSDESGHLFTKIFMNSAQECMPVKTVSVRSNDASWMTNEVRALIKERGKIHKKAKRIFF